MRLLDPVTGYADAPEGVARLDLDAEGLAGSFHIDGSVHVDGGSYIGAGIVARGVNLDARVDADPKQLLITQIVARMRRAGKSKARFRSNPGSQLARLCPRNFQPRAPRNFAPAATCSSGPHPYPFLSTAK